MLHNHPSFKNAGFSLAAQLSNIDHTIRLDKRGALGEPNSRMRLRHDSGGDEERERGKHESGGEMHVETDEQEDA